MNRKPVYWAKRGSVINLDSGFKHKLLCDGPTFSTGLVCAYSCSFCYVGAQMEKHPTVVAAKQDGHAFQDIVVRREQALNSLRQALVTPKGLPRYTDVRTIYASPLVDVAANMELVQETIEACNIILDLTPWHIRLLSKSNLLPYVAKGIPSQHKQRMIFGVSTGTLDDKLADAFEEGTARVSKRIASIHALQDDGWRTFGMICPSLPQKDYPAFSKEMCGALRIDRMEHVWGEVINVRGESMVRTRDALSKSGYSWEAGEIERISADTSLWEKYAKDTFNAHKGVIPAAKLRFLQYVTPGSRSWWEQEVSSGAVLLGPQVDLKIVGPEEDAGKIVSASPEI